MRKIIAVLVGAGSLAGCSTRQANVIIQTAWIAAVVATEVAAYSPPPEPLCSDTELDPPHTCPGTTPGPGTPPPPPPDP